MYYVYLLLLKNKQIYTGFSSDLKSRLLAHKNGKVTSTKHKRPVSLIHYEVYSLKSDAERREKFLKTSDGKKFLKRQISDLLKKYNLK
jgi:putative endonuclease